MRFNIALLPGDGVGPEVMDEALRALGIIAKKFGHEFSFQEGDVGGIAIDNHGTALPAQTLAVCKKSDAVLLAAVGGPKWDDPKAKVRPEDGLLALRKGLGLFANLRPVKVFPLLVSCTTLKPEIVRGVDLVVVRELTGGLYFGKPKKQWQTSSGRHAVDSMVYSEKEIERIARVGFELARSRRKKLASVDKANVLESSRLWRQVVIEMAPQYPDIELQHVLVDNCAMKLVQSPRDFDVIVTENTFGDIITDEASMIAGSMGMLPSASLAGVPRTGEKTFGLYEPIHGSAPKYKGLNKVNPMATILSAAMMLRYSLALEKEAAALENAVQRALEDGYRTYDIMEPNRTQLGTKEMGEKIAERI